jgi:Nif-specific regulatory protein
MLVAVAGPVQGASVALERGPVTIGRDPSNTVSIPDSSVSRKHSAVEVDAGAVRIRDLESLNGTFINGVPVQERPLRHGDQIQIGTSLFVYVLEPGPAGASASVRLDDDDIRLGSTARLTPSGARVEPASGRGLETLQKASELVAGAGSEEELARGMIDLAFEATPAHRVALLLCDEGADEPSALHGRTRRAGESSPFSVSRTVVTRVLREKEAFLANEVLRNPGLADIESLVATPVRALAAVPLVLGRPVGVLYADASDPAASFSQADLALLQALANMAAAAVDRIRRAAWRQGERRESAESPTGSGLVGESSAMKRVEQFLSRVAGSGATVLLLGESGTGKELAAQAIHRASPRGARPFVAVNCAALSEMLLESELFGHERGAFTGAIAQKRGKLEVADGGTVFLDEVGELSAALQAKLLRVLEQREFERVGGTRPIKVDIRLLAATNRNLEEAIAAGKFREDLFYRLNVVALTMPPLRERPEDIPLLASYFAARHARKLNKPTPGFSPAARACLRRYDWPGNVRELSNAIERAVVLGGEVIGTEDLPEAVLEAAEGSGEPLAGYHGAVQETKKRVIRKAVEEADFNYTEAARRLGVHPNYLHRLIRNLNLKGELKR